MPFSTSLSVSPRRVEGSHRRARLGSTLGLSPPSLAFLLAKSRARTTGQGLGLRFATIHQAQRVSTPIQGNAHQDKAWVHALPLSSKLSAFPCQVAGSHRRTRLDSTPCLSPPSSALLLANPLARTAGQGLSLRFASLHQAQRFTLPRRGLAPQHKAWVHDLPLSTRVVVSPRRVVGSHRMTRLGSTLCLSSPGSACLLIESRDRTAGQSLDPHFVSLLKAQRFSLPSRRLAPQDKAWVYALPLSTRLSVSPREVAGSHNRKRLGSTFGLSPPGTACLLAESRSRRARKGLDPCFASLFQALLFLANCGLAPQDKAWVSALPLSTRLSLSPRRVAGLHRRTKPGSTLCLSLPGFACLITESRARTAGQGLGSFISLLQGQSFNIPSHGLAPQDKA